MIQLDGLTRKSFLAAVLLCCWGGLGPGPVRAQPETETEGKALSAIVRVEIAPDSFSFAPELLGQAPPAMGAAPASAFAGELRRRLNQGASGSGFCIAPGYFLTTAHIVLAGARYRRLPLDTQQWQTLESALLAGSKPQITLFLGAGKLNLPAQVTALDREADLALLSCPGATDKVPWLPLAEPALFSVGAPVTAAGYSEEGLHISRGEILSLIKGAKVMAPGRILSTPGSDRVPLVLGDKEGDLVRIQHSAPTEPGMSGGPILSQTGKVLGISYGVISETGKAPSSEAVKMYLAVSGEMIKRFLDKGLPPETTGRETSAGESSPTPYPGFRPSAISSPLANSAGGDELDKLAEKIARQEAYAAIPLLQDRLRRNRFDFAARALLVKAHYQEALYPAKKQNNLQAAFYQAGWLANFAPELTYALPAEEFINAQESSIISYVTDPGAECLLLSRISRKTFISTLLQGRVGPGLLSQLADLTEQAESRQGRASRQDTIAAAALITSYLVEEEAEELFDPLQSNPASQANREQLLKKALALASPLASQLSACPGAHRLLASIYFRQGRLRNFSDNLERAGAELEEASRLDPTSPLLRAALTQLGK